MITPVLSRAGITRRVISTWLRSIWSTFHQWQRTKLKCAKGEQWLSWVVDRQKEGRYPWRDARQSVILTKKSLWCSMGLYTVPEKIDIMILRRSSVDTDCVFLLGRRSWSAERYRQSGPITRELYRTVELSWYISTGNVWSSENQQVLEGLVRYTEPVGLIKADNRNSLFRSHRKRRRDL